MQQRVLGLTQEGYPAAVFSSERMNQMVICTIRYVTKGFNATRALSQRSDRLGFGNTKFPNFLY
jgi:hypothetical protein